MYWVIGGIAVIGTVWYFFGNKIKTSISGMFSK